MTEHPVAIDPHEFETLNREFYAADPAEVIQARIWVLMRYLDDDATRVEYKPDQFTWGRESVPEPSERVQFAALESTLILHQAAETLLRLYFAHTGNARCPWAELTYLRVPGAFMKRVRTLREGLGSDRVMRDLMRVVSWSGDRKVIEASVTWKEKGGWTRHRQGLRTIFEFACDTVLDGADLYNAGKHGLAILPAERGVDLAGRIAVSGPSLTTIEPTDVKGEPRWVMTTRWIDYKRELLMTLYISSAIRSLWACGKQRLTKQGDQGQIQFFDGDILAEVKNVGSTMGVNVNAWRHVLFDLNHPMWTTAPPDEAEDSELT